MVVVVYIQTLIVPAVQNSDSLLLLAHPLVVYVACPFPHVFHIMVFVPLAADVMFPMMFAVLVPYSIHAWSGSVMLVNVMVTKTGLQSSAFVMFTS